MMNKLRDDERVAQEWKAMSKPDRQQFYISHRFQWIADDVKKHILEREEEKEENARKQKFGYRGVWMDDVDLQTLFKNKPEQLAVTLCHCCNNAAVCCAIADYIIATVIASVCLPIAYCMCCLF